MNYADGQQILIADEVGLAGSCGLVMAVIEDASYSSPYRAEEWGHLERGVLIEFRDLGLIHYPEPEADLVLLRRAPRS